MAELSQEERAKLLASNPDGTSKVYVEVEVAPVSKKERAAGIIKGALAIGFLAVLMYMGNRLTTTTDPNSFMSMVTGTVAIGSIIVAAAAGFYRRSAS